jgi:NitT/TauT family transport system permease protein
MISPAIEKFFSRALPIFCALVAIGGWEWWVRANNVPHYIIPAPSLVAQTLVKDWVSLYPSLLFTLKITFLALFLAIVGGVALALLFSLSKWVEWSLVPFAIILQVTPVIAIAPLILIYVNSTTAALLIVAWIVAFFPILSNTLIGLRSADRNLKDLFTLYKASTWQTLRHLLIPSALPYFIAGLKIAGGLALIGAVVAEASRILEASFRTEIPRMFAALVLVSLTGILIYALFNWISKLALGKWHESELKQER